jgi:hypothetical protein
MRIIYRLTVLGVACLLATTGVCAIEATKEAQIARIQSADEDAILEAGKSGDADYIPALEKQASGRITDRRVIAAKTALAKLGVKWCLDEILLELNDPTNSPVYRAHSTLYGSPPGRYEAIRIRNAAFGKLQYVNDRSTIKVVASFLYTKENPMDYVEGAEPGSTDVVFFEWPSEVAMKVLAQIVDNPPTINIPDNAYTHDARVKAWQQWWEQNKDKYP